MKEFLLGSGNHLIVDQMYCVTHYCSILQAMTRLCFRRSFTRTSSDTPFLAARSDMHCCTRASK